MDVLAAIAQMMRDNGQCSADHGSYTNDAAVLSVFKETATAWSLERTWNDRHMLMMQQLLDRLQNTSVAPVREVTTPPHGVGAAFLRLDTERQSEHDIYVESGGCISTACPASKRVLHVDQEQFVIPSNKKMRVCVDANAHGSYEHGKRFDRVQTSHEACVIKQSEIGSDTAIVSSCNPDASVDRRTGLLRRLWFSAHGVRTTRSGLWAL